MVERGSFTYKTSFSAENVDIISANKHEATVATVVYTVSFDQPLHKAPWPVLCASISTTEHNFYVIYASGVVLSYLFILFLIQICINVF